MRRCRRLIGMLLTVAMIFSMITVTFAEEVSKYPDFPTGWSKDAMTAAVSNGLLNGYEDGKIYPEANLTRAQFAAIIVRAFGAKTKADISAYTDVPANEWYYSDIAKAVKMGALNGKSESKMDPDAPITRQETFTAVARIFVLSDDDTSALGKFNDSAKIASWAAKYMAALVKRGYVNGDDKGNSNPESYISREEFAQFMHNAIRTYITKPGTYTDDLQGIVVVRVGNVYLKDLKITSDLIIGDGVDTENITISGVDIEKRLLTRGGTIKVLNSTLGDFVVVNNVNGITNFKNYRSEAFFKGIVENTVAKFLTTSSGGGSAKNKIYTLTLKVDGSIYDKVTVTNGVPNKTVTDPAKDFYIFDGWYDASDNKITNFGTVTRSQVLNAKFIPKEYNIEYIDVTWKDGYVLPDSYKTYNIENVTSFELPSGDNVVAPSGEQFLYWVTEDGSAVNLTITHDTPDLIKVKPYFGPMPTEPVTVTFYSGYSASPTEDDVIKTLAIEKGETVNAEAFPQALVRTGYKKDASVAHIYEEEWKHEIASDFWYIKDGVMTLFDSNVNVNENINVYRLTKTFSFLLGYETNNGSQSLQVSAFYNDKTRILNSLKDIIAKSARQQLELALANDMIPKYDEAVGAIIDKMVSAGVVKLDGDKKNLQLIKIPFKISTFVKEEIANNMIRQYLRDVVKNPSELDKIFSIIDVSEFAGQMGIDTIIANMSDAEIVSLMKSSEYKDDIVDFVLTDLKQTDSKMMNFVIDYVVADDTFRDDLIDQIIADLKDKDKTSTLKTKALEYIKTQIDDETSAFYAKFVDMIAADLKSDSSVVMDEVVSYIRTNLKADTQKGKDLRKAILTSSQLRDFLANDKMKAEVINLALDDAFIEKALNNAGYREVLVEAIMDDDDFVDLLLASQEFHDYIIDQLHPVAGQPNAHPLAKDVKDLVEDDSSSFREYILDLVKESDSFTSLFDSHPELIQVVSSEIEWSDFVSDEEDLLKFIFNQSGVSGSYSFISRAEIEAMIEDAYNELDEFGRYALTETTDAYSLLSNANKQKVRDAFFGNNEVRAEVLNKAETEFNTYKTDMVNKIVEGKADEITDETVTGIVDTLLVEYITKYINLEDLHEDDAIDASIKGVIEEILFDFISDLIHGVDLNNDELEAELSTMISHIDSVKHQFVVDPTDEVVARLKLIVINYKNSPEANIRQVVSNNYAELTDKIVAMLDPDDSASLYSEIESALKSENVADYIDAGLIKDYVKGISDNDLKDLIKKYMEILTVADLNNYIASFLTVEANVNAVKVELNTFIQDDEQKETIKDFAKTYINDPLNEEEIEENVSKFIDGVDETFVHQNRAVITDALMNIDITAFVDEQFIKDYVAGLSDAQKNEFADDIFEALQTNAQYTKFMNQLLTGSFVEIDKSNASMLTVMAAAIRNLSFDSVINFIDNAALEKLLNTVGEAYIEPITNEMIEEYCDGLDAAINEVKFASDETFKKTYTTSLTLRINLFELYKKITDKVKDGVIEKLENANIYYSENKYLKFLVEQDFLNYMFDGDETLANGDFTGYSLRGVMDYYDYFAMLLIVGDDAITWYGNEEEGLTETQFEALYDAIFDKIFAVHSKMNEILAAFSEDGTLPSQIQGALDNITQLNGIMVNAQSKSKAFIEKYLASNINVKFEDGSIAEDTKVVKFVDFLIGNEEPVINIGTIYATIAEFDDAIQPKLKELVESDKFKAAVEKFESSSFGELFSGKGTLGTIGDKLDELRANGRIESSLDSVFDFFYLVANEGMDAFKVPASEMEVTDIDIYEVGIGKVKITLQRAYK